MHFPPRAGRYAQFRLARTLAQDLRRPWEKPLTPDQLTPGRVRRGYPRTRQALGHTSQHAESHPPRPRPPQKAAPPPPRPATQSPKNITNMTCPDAAEQRRRLKDQAKAALAVRPPLHGCPRPCSEQPNLHKAGPRKPGHPSCVTCTISEVSIHQNVRQTCVTCVEYASRYRP
ncbi:hypothetical protein FCI23_42590 [Actinacidiphila oryziradicis]|uniref:Uncharacterized protein n=1 Tax=Actinacidiphila oryziradicis TaxID=2571141 RepID=A0A4V5MZ18_9ACTN|nr:hypothetical protein FCI23_42590 [Actinacidiphila oryziradicis]